MKMIDLEIEGKRHYFDWLTMNDFMSLYTKKHTLEMIVKNEGDDKARQYLYSILDDMYPQIPEKYRMMVFIYLVISSEGKKNLVLINHCDKCNAEHNITVDFKFNVGTEKYNIIDVDNNKITIDFNPINQRSKDEYIHDLYSGIKNVAVNGYDMEWDLLSEDTKMNILSYVNQDDIKKLVDKLIPCTAVMSNAVGCDIMTDLNDKVITDELIMFEWLISKEEINTIFKIATIMTPTGITFADYMNMPPFIRKEVLKNIKNNHENANKER